MRGRMIEAIRDRRSVRTYLKKEVEERKLKEILTAAMYAPTSWGMRAWEFVVVREKALKEALSRATAHSKFVKNAPVVVIICYDVSTGRRFREDSSIAAGHIWLEAVNQGLGTCFVQVADAGDPPGRAEPYVKGLLDIPDGYRVQCMMPIGYPSRRLKPHSPKEYNKKKVRLERF